MLLSELTKLLAAQRKLAKKAGVDPEVRMAISPKWPVEGTMESSLVSTLEEVGDIDGNHFIYFLEKKEIGYLDQGIIEAAGWGRPAPKRRTS